MSLVYAFLFSGTVCLIGEIIINHTKLTPGHVTSLFAFSGAVFAYFNLYDNLINKCGMGAIVLISNFGNSLYKSGMIGFKKEGIIGLFKNMLSSSSLVLTSTIILSFIFIMIFRPKD